MKRRHTTSASPGRAAGRTDRARAALLETAGEGLNDGGFAPEVLRAVFFVGSRPDFPSALDAALAFAGPANYCPVLVGALGGARWGAAAVPAGPADPDLRPRVGRAALVLAESWT